MTERVEDLPPPRSRLTLAMLGAFAVGAGVAGWAVFGDDFRGWTRAESFAWEPTVGEHLVLIQTQRTERELTGAAPDVLFVQLEWTIVPEGPGPVTGEATTWTQSLRSARAQYRGPDGFLDAAWPLATIAEGEAPQEFDLSALPGWASLLSPSVGLPLGARLDAQALLAGPNTAPEVLSMLDPAPAKAPPAGEAELRERALLDGVGWLTQNVAVDLASWAQNEVYRPGQVWSREARIAIGDWGMAPLKLELKHEGYEGDLALLSALVTRMPGDAAMSSSDGLSGLKGTGAYRVDVLKRRVVAGHLDLEARGKLDRKFATIRVSRAFALASADETPTIPSGWAPMPLPPPEEADNPAE